MIKGKVIFVGTPENGVSKAGKQWSKQVFAIETEGQYPKKVAFSVMNNKFTMNVGDFVEVEVDASSREYQGKWYTELNCWKCNNLSNPAQNVPQPVYQQQAPQGYQQPQYPQNPPQQAAPQQTQPYSQPTNSANSDLPF